MKKIIQLALLMGIINTTTNYCWGLSNLVPSSVQKWYQNRQIRKEEEKQFKVLTGIEQPSYEGLYIRHKPTQWKDISVETINEEMEYHQKEKEFYDKLHSLEKGFPYYNESDNPYKHHSDLATRDIAILRKYQWLPSVKLHDNYIRKINKTGWGY